MIKVKNKKVINNLAVKSFKASKSRNIIAVMAIALTTILFTSLFTVGTGMVETIQQQTLRQVGGDGHVVLKYITDEQFEKIENHPLINEISYNKIIADSVDNHEFLKRRAEMYYMDSVGMKLGFCEPTVGSPPKTEKEIITDTSTLDLLGIPHEIGAVVPITYTIKGKQIKTDFVLSGYWESDPAFSVGFILVSEAFTKANEDLIKYTYKEDHSLSGVINAYVMFKNAWNLEKKMFRIVLESGYTIDDENPDTAPLPTDIPCNTNWAYLGSNSIDAGSLIGMVMAIMLIIFTGYLIIYNIFQISVLRDIRFYGLLKTIGTTSKQIKRIIRIQALILSSVGVPVGLVIGFLIGKGILPVIMAQSTYGAEYATVSMNPLIFISAAIFSLITVFISTRKPGKIAAKVSPVEAVKYNDSSLIKKSTKTSTNGGKLHKMSLSNLSRNKKRTVITILSLSLSLVILNSIFTISQGFDMDKYLSTFVDTDFLIGHAKYFINDFHMTEDGLTESFIEAVKSEDAFQDGGRLYKNIYVGDCTIYRENPKEPNKFYVNTADNGLPMLDLYGLDDLPLSRFDIVEGDFDIEKLKTGKYIIEGLLSDDNGDIYPETSHYNIGDMVTINVDGKTYEYELMAKSKVKHYTNTCRAANNYTMYLPSKEYLNIVTKPVLMTYAFNVKDGMEDTMEQFVKSYTENIEPAMNYESKQVYVDKFKDMQSMIIIVGGVLSGIIGLIGILNFINSMLTSILSRLREFAILQGIGMTKKQLMKILVYEGLYYAVGTMILSLILGIIFSLTIIKGMVGNLWFFSYKFIVIPLFITYPVLLIISVVVPYIVYHTMEQQSIVERLREVE